MRVMQHGLLMLSGLAATAGCLDRDPVDADRPPAQAGSISSAVTGAVCPGGSTVPGIDVSTYQGSVDWAKVAASGRKFAITRIGNGVNISDSTFAANWSGMAAAGMIRGAYQYFEPAQDAVDQANIVVAKLGQLGDGDLPAMLDMEVSGGQSASTITSKIHQWVDTVARGTGKTPMIYTGAYFWDGSVKSSDFADLPLVIAWYGTDCPGMPDAWSGWTFHQYTDAASVSGVSGGVDGDVFNGSLTELQSFAGTTTEMQLVVQTSTGLYHTVRSPAWTKFGNVENQAGTLTNLTTIAEAGVGASDHVLAVANDTVYHAIRHADGSWTDWGNVEGQSGPLSSVTALSAAGVGNQLQVVALAGDTIHHTIRHADGSWTDWGNVEGKAGALAGITGIATAGVNGELHVLATANDTLYHAIRHADGTWTSWGNVEGQAGTVTGLTSVAAAGVNGQLQVVVVASDTIRHVIRSASGSWTSWGNVENQSGALSGVTGITAASVAGQLQVMAISSAGLKHAIRSASGAWTDWGTVTNVADGLTGTPLHIAAAGT